ncbi:hypothetical protein [Brevundimonas vesicularis]|uniref:hypothetical protein n=1 Tax=Brevundimonas vesicularis TaxID=41276 RepID=UPI00384D4F26
MVRISPLLALLCIGCVADQPESLQTVAAFEVPLPTATDKSDFLALMRQEAIAQGYHLDAASDDQLRALSRVSPLSLNASIWRGNDEENMVSAMDGADHVGRIWITFSKGENPEQSAKLQKSLISKITQRWPDTTALPIMPSGAIPLARDLVRTPLGYEVRASEASKYQAERQ